MCELAVTREDVGGRSKVHGLAPEDPQRALAVAKAIRHPWYRCQALAKVAEYLPSSDAARVLDHAFAAAEEQCEPNRVVTVSAWPLRVALGVEHAAPNALTKVRHLVAVAERESHNLRRAHALQSLSFSVAGNAEAAAVVARALVEAILGGGGSRMDRVIREVFPFVAESNPELLPSLVAHHKPNAQQQKLLARLSELEI